jgi:chemotaxis family two-component system sensor kinase Cph1
MSAAGGNQSDAEFCGRVPLNQTNLVQPHGVLLILGRGDFTVLQCSENAGDRIGIDAPQLVGRTLESLIPSHQFVRMQTRLSQQLPGKIPLSLTLNEREFLVLFESHPDYYIAELEPVTGEQASFVELYQDLKFSMSAIESARTTEEACRIIAHELKRFSGFDKVMIYRFDSEWNGEVIAEERALEMDAYLGLKFPASDIPRQARELYRTNPYRFIPDVNYTPIRLYPVLNPRTHTFTDLSNSNLRSVAAVHIEYLRNMELGASMSTRILRNGELWGLIACHHRTARFLSYQACSVFEFLSHIISAKISSVENTDAHAYRALLHRDLGKIVERLSAHADLRQGLQAQASEVRALLRADGLCFVVEGQVYSSGETPDNEAIRDLVYWLQSQGVTRSFVHPSLSKVYENADSYADIASGLLALPIHPAKESFVLAFRAEAVQDVAWGGNPNEAIRFEPDRKAYHPRNSFRQWKQKVVGTAVSWRTEELEIAEQFRSFVIEHTLNKS